VLATGATHSYFGHEEWSRYAPGLKTIDDALEMRERMLLAFEAAERETEPERQRDWLTFVIIGGGPTGVELAGALAYMTRHTLRGEFRHIDPTSARVVLLEGLPRILTAYSEDLSASAQRSLERLGVEVRTHSMVTSVDAEGVTVGDKTRIRARTVLWGAGVAASPLARSLGAPLDKAGRVKVTPALTVPGREDVFVIGDLASVVEQAEAGQGKPVPGVAPAAMQMGRHAARNILRQLQGKPLVPFHYQDRGLFAVIGRGAAIGVLFNRWKMRGRLAWLLWVGVHITYLIGFRNRLSVLLNWAHTYFTKKRDVRLITGVHAQRLPKLALTPVQALSEQAPSELAPSEQAPAPAEQQPAPAY
jgi:NADH dehydrogenase